MNDPVEVSEPVWVLGAGGHGKVVIGALQAAGRPVAGVLDANSSLHGSEVLGVRVIGPISREQLEEGVVAVVAIGQGGARRRVAESLDDRVRWATVIHPASWVDPSVKVGPGTVIFAGAVVQPDTTIGRHAVVNTGASVDHDNVLGDYAFVGPGAHLAGEVRLDEGAFLGIGVSVLPGCTVGAWATVGAGAVVVRDVEAEATVVGVPAR